MHYMMFGLIQAIGFAILYFTYRGVFDLITAGLAVCIMLALSFHVIARKADSISTRVACFTAALWFAGFLAGRLFFEFRDWGTTLIAAIFCFICVAPAVVSTIGLATRPADMDIDI